MPAWDAQRYEIRNVTRGTVVATQSGRASNLLARGFGLMLHRSLPTGGGLIIEPCNSVVCFFMRFPIDVLFVAEDGKVLQAVPGLRPWHTSSIVRGSRRVIELPEGTVERSETKVGDFLEWRPVQADRG